jgi:hypothetical protein
VTYTRIVGCGVWSYRKRQTNEASYYSAKHLTSILSHNPEVLLLGSLQYWWRRFLCSGHKPRCTIVYSCDRSSVLLHLPWQLHFTSFINKEVWTASLHIFTGFRLSAFWPLWISEVSYCRMKIIRQLDSTLVIYSRAVGTWLHHRWVGEIWRHNILIWMPLCCWTWLPTQRLTAVQYI